MPDFVDHFNGEQGTPVTGWSFAKEPRDSAEAAVPWIYNPALSGSACHDDPAAGGGSDTLMYKGGLVTGGGRYDATLRFKGFQFAEAFIRYSNGVSAKNQRLAVLVQNSIGRLVLRDDDGDTQLTQWTRSSTSEFEIYLFNQVDYLNIMDSGAAGVPDNIVFSAILAAQASNGGIGVGNGWLAQATIRDLDGAYASHPFDLSPGKNRVEGSGTVTDVVTDAPALPQVENIAGLTVEAYTIVDGEPQDAGGNAPSATLTTSTAGTWRITARGPGEASLDITSFRGVPTLMSGEMTDTDPFGPDQASIVLPAITIFDKVGINDLEWLTESTEVDIELEGWDPPAGYPHDRFCWEGLVGTFDYGDDGLTVTLTGALRQLDSHLAKPAYPHRPLSYELAIANLLRERPDLRVGPLDIVLAGDAPTFNHDPEQPEYMRPVGVVDGQRWTGLVTRSTGAWEQSLSSYAQTLVASMYTATGRYTLMLDPGRRPVLRHRVIPTVYSAADHLLIDPAAPGVKVSVSEDWTQTANAIFGQGTSLAGEAWSGQRVSNDGQRTYYEPLAVDPAVDPQDGAFTSSKIRREVLLQVQQGLNLQQATAAAQAHLERFGTPGVVGSITLETDPKLGGQFIPRMAIRAGMTCWVPHLLGTGKLLHITKVNANRDSGVVTLTVDSKYRDALTVGEVMVRGRDSLAITRGLIGGQYAPPIPDQLVPWDYAAGSGYIPSYPDGEGAQRLFEGYPDVEFPWSEITRLRRPSNSAWSGCYIHLNGPASTNADENWATRALTDEGVKMAIPVRAAQQASIRLLQIAAYDVNGYVMPVRFHVSFYGAYGTGVASMPQLDAAQAALHAPYLAGQRYPLFDGAFERYKTDGTQIQTEQPLSVSSAGLIRGYGTKQAPAGCWPNPASPTSRATGLLVDEGVFEIDTTRLEPYFTPYQVTQRSPYAGFIHVMIYCDEHIEDVYFLGRMVRTEPGATV